MMYRYQCLECGKTLITESAVDAPTRTCLCGTLMIGSPYTMPTAPLSTELLTAYAIDAASKLRGELCVLWGIKNKSHKSHGSNFSAPQTLKSLIDNIMAPVSGTDRDRVRRLVVDKYSYNIDSQMMA